MTVGIITQNKSLWNDNRSLSEGAYMVGVMPITYCIGNIYHALKARKCPNFCVVDEADALSAGDRGEERRATTKAGL